MSEELESLRAEVAALRAELAEQRDARVTRRRLLTGLAGLGAVSAAGIAAAPRAAAEDGDPLLLGRANESDFPTSIEWGTPSEYPDGEESEGVLMLGGHGSPGLWARSTDVAVDAAGGIYGITAFGHGFGVAGRADHFAGVSGTGTDFSTGVMGTAEKGAGLYGESAQGPSLFLKPSGTVGPPLFTWDGTGAVSVDPNGDLWLCVAGGDDPTWTRLMREDTAAGRVIPITPFRAIDTRASGGRSPGGPAVPGQVKGPLRGGQAVTLDLAGVGPVPPTASGVIGNATVVLPTASGYLRVMPAGASVPASSFNFNRGITIANGFTCGLSSTGLRTIAPVSTNVQYHLVIDIAAYIT